MILKTFESFVEDKERENQREIVRQQEQEIIANFTTEPLGVEVVLSSDVNDSDETLAMGKSIANEFPIELVEEPQSEYFSTEKEINHQFPIVT